MRGARQPNAGNRRTFVWSAALLSWLGAAAAADAAEAWLPLVDGSRRVYAVHRDRVFDPDDQANSREFYFAEETERMRAVDGGFRLTRKTVEDSVQGSGRQRREVTSLLVATPEGVRMRREETRNFGAAVDRSTDYDPPLLLMPATPEPGRSWRVGALRRDAQLVTELQATVVGFEEVTVDGTAYPDCLHVRYEGTLRGSVSSEAGPLAVERGRVETDAWYRAGLGLVREVGTWEVELTLPDGVGARLRETLTRRLADASPP